MLDHARSRLQAVEQSFAAGQQRNDARIDRYIRKLQRRIATVAKREMRKILTLGKLQNAELGLAKGDAKAAADDAKSSGEDWASMMAEQLAEGLATGNEASKELGKAVGSQRDKLQNLFNLARRKGDLIAAEQAAYTKDSQAASN